MHDLFSSFICEAWSHGPAQLQGSLGNAVLDKQLLLSLNTGLWALRGIKLGWSAGHDRHGIIHSFIPHSHT